MLLNFKLLKDSRQAAGLTQWELADKTGVGKRTISLYEKGLAKAPNAFFLAYMMQALDIKPNDFFINPKDRSTKDA